MNEESAKKLSILSANVFLPQFSNTETIIHYIGLSDFEDIQ